jgi:hypothetical protein
LAGSLHELGPALALAVRCQDRLNALGADGLAFFREIVGPLVAPIARRAYESIGGGSGDQVVSAIEEVNASLAGANVLHVLPRTDVMSWSISALLRATEAPLAAVGPPHLEGYRQFRAAMGRATFASLIVDFYLKLVQPAPDLLDPDVVVQRVADIVNALPAETRAVLAQRDRAQLEEVVGYLERWWTALSEALPAAGNAALEALVASRFFEVTHDEGALTRFALEARLSAMVFGEETIAPLLARVAEMERVTTDRAERSLAAYAGSEEGSLPAPAARKQR